ncbi:MAG: L-histidine N(alpha)-methyltransferase [Gemmatimonadaceae bacterium]
MLNDVGRGLSREQKELPPTYFYDETGSALFERITRLPEYYLTRTEHALEALERAYTDAEGLTSGAGDPGPGRSLPAET